jgi:hypothetical protein
MPRLSLECVVVIASDHGLRSRGARHRWSCEPWTTAERAKAGGEAHVLDASNVKESI